MSEYDNLAGETEAERYASLLKTDGPSDPKARVAALDRMARNSEQLGDTRISARIDAQRDIEWHTYTLDDRKDELSARGQTAEDIDRDLAVTSKREAIEAAQERAKLLDDEMSNELKEQREQRREVTQRPQGHDQEQPSSAQQDQTEQKHKTETEADRYERAVKSRHLAVNERTGEAMPHWSDERGAKGPEARADMLKTLGEDAMQRGDERLGLRYLGQRDVEECSAKHTGWERTLRNQGLNDDQISKDDRHIEATERLRDAQAFCKQLDQEMSNELQQQRGQQQGAQQDAPPKQQLKGQEPPAKAHDYTSPEREQERQRLRDQALTDLYDGQVEPRQPEQTQTNVQARKIDGYEAKQQQDRVDYMDQKTGALAFSDKGKQIAVGKGADTQAIDAALKLAADKFKGPIAIKGTDEFIAKANERAKELGISDRVRSQGRDQKAQQSQSTGQAQEHKGSMDMRSMVQTMRQVNNDAAQKIYKQQEQKMDPIQQSKQQGQSQ